MQSLMDGWPDRKCRIARLFKLPSHLIVQFSNSATPLVKIKQTDEQVFSQEYDKQNIRMLTGKGFTVI
jgi:hypothetical protein